MVTVYIIVYMYKVAIPRGTGRSYGIHWRSGMRATDETKVTDEKTNERTEGRKDERTEGQTDGRTERIA